MGKFNKTGKKEMPALNTSSLPDLIFTLLFFFMIVTTMREVTLKVEFKVPQATELEKLEKQLRKIHTKRLNNGECTAQAGINYVDYLSHYTRIADHAINLVEKVTEGVI